VIIGGRGGYGEFRGDYIGLGCVLRGLEVTVDFTSMLVVSVGV